MQRVLHNETQTGIARRCFPTFAGLRDRLIERGIRRDLKKGLISPLEKRIAANPNSARHVLRLLNCGDEEIQKRAKAVLALAVEGDNTEVAKKIETMLGDRISEVKRTDIAIEAHDLQMRETDVYLHRARRSLTLLVYTVITPLGMAGAACIGLSVYLLVSSIF